MLKYDLKKRLDIKRLSEHQFITKEMKNFTKIDKKEVGNNLSGSQIIFDLNYSTNPYFHDDAADEEVIEEEPADDSEEEFAEEGIKIVYFPYTKGISSTKINEALDAVRKHDLTDVK